MPSDDATAVRRRAVLAGSVAALGALAGCSVLSDGEDDVATAEPTPTATRHTTTEGTATPPRPRRTLRLGIRGDATRVIENAVTAWNANEPPRRHFFGGEAVDVEVSGRVADHFAGAEGLEPTETAASPPVTVAPVGVTDHDALRRGLLDGHLDLGVAGVVDDEESVGADPLRTTVLGYGGHACFVSPALADAGVAATNAELRAVYTGEITNWATLGGPDRQITVAAGAAGTPPRPFRRRFLGPAAADGVDIRFGSPSNRAEYIESRDDAVGELPVGSVGASLPTLSVTDRDETYGPRSDAYGPSYPLYGLSTRESPPSDRAVLAYLRSPLVQYRLERHRDLLGYEPLDTAPA